MLKNGIKIISFIGMALGTPAVALDTFTPPTGCAGTLTVQHHACIVAHVWKCEADAEGDSWMSLIGQNGPLRVFKVDRDFQWLETYTPEGTERLVLPAPDPASLSALLETGVDTYDFTIEKDGETERVVGTDRLPGTETIIDEEPLLDTDYTSDQVTSDGEIQSSVGHQYISVRHRLFFLGQSWNRDTPDEVNDASPVEFIYPGEPGFLSTNPKFDCGTILSEYQP